MHFIKVRWGSINDDHLPLLQDKEITSLHALKDSKVGEKKEIMFKAYSKMDYVIQS